MENRRYGVIVETRHGESSETPAWFFQLGPSVIYDGGNNPVPVTGAFVERIHDGRLLEVEPHAIKFVEEPVHGVVL